MRGEATGELPVNVLDHKAAAEMIPRYLDDSLRDRELLAFLAHVRSCHSCYEELETEFMVNQTVRYLNDELDDSLEGAYDLTAMMQEDIRRKLAEAGRRRALRRAGMILSAAAAVLVILMLLDFFGVLQLTRLLA